MALLGVSRMQCLAWALRGERVVYSFPKRAALANGARPRTPGVPGPAVGLDPTPASIAIGITRARPSRPLRTAGTAPRRGPHGGHPSLSGA